MIILYKPVGITPLQAIEKFRKQNKGYEERVLSYAGRLDPMAEGLLMVLVGDENKKRRDFEKSDKTYEFEALIGISTDSYDLLGIPVVSNKKFDDKKIIDFVNRNKGKISQKYPSYSSVKIKGRPLYYWTRKKENVKIPEREVVIRDFEVVDSYRIEKSELKTKIFSVVRTIIGDFRQKEILDSWSAALESAPNDFVVYRFELSCSSGTYVRSIVDALGKFIKCGALTYSIKRTRIDGLSQEDAIYI